MLTFSSKSRPRRRLPDDRPASGRGLAPLSTPQRADEPQAAGVEEEGVTHKGWHDSSSDLKRGLQVVEDVPLDTLPAELRDDLSRRR